MSILVAIDSFTSSGQGTAITTPSRFKNITVLVGGSGNATSLGLDVLMADGTWVNNLFSTFNQPNLPTLQRIDGSSSVGAGMYRLAFYQQMGNVSSGSVAEENVIIQGIRSNVSGTGLSLKVQVQAESL